jgi:hypothetical protein
MRTALAAAALLLAASGTALGQPIAEVESEGPTPGWVFTPRVAFGITHDSNPLFATEGNLAPDDAVTSVSPALNLGYTGKHTYLGVGYNGSVVRYRTLEEYDSFDQGLRTEFRHQATRRVALHATNTFTKAPTTEILDLAGVPYVRTGIRQNFITGGTSVQATRNLTITGTYGHQWVEFDRPAEERSDLLEGGTMHTVTFGAAQALSARVRVGAEYSWRHALVGEVQEVFNIQNAEGTVHVQLSPTLSLQGGAGLSYLSLPSEFGSRTGPAARIALHKRTPRATYAVSFSHSFVPSFGFGGSHRNSELGGHVRAPIGRRGYTQGLIAWRSSSPVLERELGLRAVALQWVVGYAAQRWLRLEGFYTGAFQDTPVAGGRADRNRVGFQIVTLRPMRLQ